MGAVKTLGGLRRPIENVFSTRLDRFTLTPITPSNSFFYFSGQNLELISEEDCSEILPNSKRKDLTNLDRYLDRLSCMEGLVSPLFAFLPDFSPNTTFSFSNLFPKSTKFYLDREDLNFEDFSPNEYALGFELSSKNQVRLPLYVVRYKEDFFDKSSLSVPELFFYPVYTSRSFGVTNEDCSGIGYNSKQRFSFGTLTFDRDVSAWFGSNQ